MGKTGRRQNKHGFVFSIDATIGAFLVILILATSVFFSSQAQDDPYGKLHLARVARDALNSMDERGTLQYGNYSQINDSLNGTLKEGMGANLLVETYYYDPAISKAIYLNSTIYGKAVPNDEDAYSVRHDFVSLENGLLANYSIARMTIWQE